MVPSEVVAYSMIQDPISGAPPMDLPNELWPPCQHPVPKALTIRRFTCNILCQCPTKRKSGLLPGAYVSIFRMVGYTGPYTELDPSVRGCQSSANTPLRSPSPTR